MLPGAGREEIRELLLNDCTVSFWGVEHLGKINSVNGCIVF